MGVNAVGMNEIKDNGEEIVDMKRSGLIAALAVGAGVVLGACGDDGGASRDELVDELVNDADMTQEVAECFIDELGVDKANELRDAEESNDISDDLQTEATDAMMTCSTAEEPAE